MTTSLRTVRREALRVLTIAGVLSVGRASFADHYHVPSGSMEPTIFPGDQVCVNKLAYGLRLPESTTYVAETSDPARGDVVVLASPTDGTVLLKRVVAVPGDVVTVLDGRVRIDGVQASERDASEGRVEVLDGRAHAVGTELGGGPDFGPERVPVHAYLVLGDNRGNSRDGRFFGFVERGRILGRAVSVCARDGHATWNPL